MKSLSDFFERFNLFGYYIGHETWVNRVRGIFKALLFTFFSIFGGQLVLAFFLFCVTHFAIVKEFFSLLYTVGAAGFTGANKRSVNFIVSTYHLCSSDFWATFRACWFLWVALPASVAYFTLFSKKLQDKKHIRGSEIVEVDELKDSIKGKETGLKVKYVATLPAVDFIYEPQHVLDMGYTYLNFPKFVEPRGWSILGKAGSGKSTLIFQMLDSIIKAGEAAVIHDPSGEFAEAFYNEGRGDIIFNTFDARFPGWNLFNDMHDFADYSTVANVQIPDPKGSSDPYWFLAPRQIQEAVYDAIRQSNPNPCNKSVTEVKAGGGAAIKKLIAAYSPDVANGHLDDPKNKTVASLLSVLLAFTKPIDYLKDGPFSIGEWLANPKGRIIFVTNYAAYKSMLKPINSIFFELLATKLMSMKKDERRGIWVLLDEVTELDKLKFVTKMPATVRKFGGRMLFGAQSYAQVDELYSKEGRRDAFNSLGTKFYFAVSDFSTAEEFSKEIGKVQYQETDINESGGVNDNKDGFSIVRKKTTEDAILPVQIQQLRVFEHYLKIDGGYKWCHGIIHPNTYKAKVEGFVEAPGLNKSEILREAAKKDSILATASDVLKEIADKKKAEEVELAASGSESKDLAEEAATSNTAGITASGLEAIDTDFSDGPTL